MLILYVNILQGWPTPPQTTYPEITILCFFAEYRCLIAANPTPSSTATNHQHPRSRLDISTLQSVIQSSSLHTQALRHRHPAISFCQSINHTPTPTSKLTLLLFVAHLAQSQLSLSTIKVYLSAVHSLHLTSGFLGMFNTQSTPRLGQVLQLARDQKISSLLQITHHSSSNHYPNYA